jgi:hypothetical protein
MKRKNRRLNHLPSVNELITIALLVGDQYGICQTCYGTRKVHKTRCYICYGIGLSGIGDKTIEAAQIPMEALPSWRQMQLKNKRLLARLKKAPAKL